MHIALDRVGIGADEMAPLGDPFGGGAIQPRQADAQGGGDAKAALGARAERSRAESP